MNVVAIARDYDGLKQAAFELLEEARMEPQNEKLRRLAEQASNTDRVLDGIKSQRTLAEGYYVRIGFLLELESVLQLGVELKLNLDLSEMQGLRSIQQARREFGTKHPPCRGCGTPVDEHWQARCPECERSQFEQQAAARRAGN